ncbi:hypothetical protein HOY82DRAFT_546779 [Tuber indicum]|nr:hypothetical protein HOY82DRAFT_546779 [Tuber indicum]
MTSNTGLVAPKFTSPARPLPPNVTLSAYNRRLDHLLSSGAFTRATLGFDVTRTLRSAVKRLFSTFLTRTQGTIHIKANTTFGSLRSQVPTLNSIAHASARYENDGGSKKLRSLASSDVPLEIKDSRGVVLGYRFCLPPGLVEALEESSKLLPTLRRNAKGKRGDYLMRHYVLSADSVEGIVRSKGYQQEQVQADQWLDANKLLFKRVSETLQMYNPEMWVSMTSSMKKATGGELSGFASPWHGVAIGHGMGPEGGPNRQDRGDPKTLFKAVIPFGAEGWEGGEIALWQLGLKVEVRRGECLFFNDAVIAHRTLPVTTGRRNFVELFCDSSIYNVAEKKRKVQWGARRGDKRKVMAKQNRPARGREAIKEKRKGRTTKRTQQKKQLNARAPNDDA